MKKYVCATTVMNNSYIGELALKASDAITEFQESLVETKKLSDFLSEDENNVLDKAIDILWDIYVTQHPSAIDISTD